MSRQPGNQQRVGKPGSLYQALRLLAGLLQDLVSLLLGLLTGLALIPLSNGDGPPLADTATFLVAFAVALYSTGRYTGGRAAVAGGAAVAAALPLAVIEVPAAESRGERGEADGVYGHPERPGRCCTGDAEAANEQQRERYVEQQLCNVEFRRQVGAQHEAFDWIFSRTAAALRERPTDSAERRRKKRLVTPYSISLVSAIAST